MATELEYALMAGAAYFSTRAPINQFPVPTGWTQLGTSLDNSSGFEAVAFQQGNNIVISYAGTYPGVADITADGLLGLGYWSAQLGEAAAYYLGLRQIYGSSATISFTGHSLGGGLASLMAVFFNQPATTFDQAPFALSLGLRSTLIANLESQYGYTAQQLLTLAPSLVNPQTPGNGAANVTDFSVAGQLLGSTPPVSWFNNIGTQQQPLANGSTGVSATDLHSQALLTLFVMNDQFRQATMNLTDLEKLLFSSTMFAFQTGPASANRNILELLIQHQEGIQNVLTPDNMLTRFTADLWQIAQAGSITMTDKTVSDALIACAMQSYYEGANSTDPTKVKQLFTTVTGGIEFAITDVSKTGTLDTAKGYSQYFENILTGDKDINFTYLTTAERNVISAALPSIHDWYVQAGMTGMYAADLNNVNDFMLGGTGNNSLSGGTGNDTLIAGTGADFLQGGQGNDTLISGTGNASIYDANCGESTNDAGYAAQLEWRTAA